MISWIKRMFSHKQTHTLDESLFQLSNEQNKILFRLISLEKEGNPEPLTNLDFSETSFEIFEKFMRWILSQFTL